MRLILAICFALLLFRSPVACAIETVEPGTRLDAATEIMRKHGYDVDARKYGLAMSARDREHALEFCRIDANTTLVMEYRLSNRKIDSLGVEIIPDYAPKSQRRRVSLEVLEIGFEEGGIYTLRLKRQTKHAVSNKAAESR